MLIRFGGYLSSQRENGGGGGSNKMGDVLCILDVKKNSI